MEQVFIETRVAVAPGAWLETAVKARLHETIEVFAEVRIEKEGETRVKQILVAKDKSRGSLVDIIGLQINQAAEVESKETVGGLNEERFVEAFKPVGLGEGCETRGKWQSAEKKRKPTPRNAKDPS
ncbi:MAG: hypothetical protein EXS36_10400 [Pedosphaera sp.]|nr:hypothetical protein [Pedosphaera sp.]